MNFDTVHFFTAPIDGKYILVRRPPYLCFAFKTASYRPEISAFFALQGFCGIKRLGATRLAAARDAVDFENRSVRVEIYELVNAELSLIPDALVLPELVDLKNDSNPYDLIVQMFREAKGIAA